MFAESINNVNSVDMRAKTFGRLLLLLLVLQKMNMLMQRYLPAARITMKYYASLNLLALKCRPINVNSLDDCLESEVNSIGTSTFGPRRSTDETIASQSFRHFDRQTKRPDAAFPGSEA